MIAYFLQMVGRKYKYLGLYDTGALLSGLPNTSTFDVVHHPGWWHASRYATECDLAV